MEPLLVGLPCRRLNANRRRYSSHNNLGNTSRFELGFNIGCCECAEGAVWEAASLAGVNQLNNLIAIVDVNRLGQSQV